MKPEISIGYVRNCGQSKNKRGNTSEYSNLQFNFALLLIIIQIQKTSLIAGFFVLGLANSITQTAKNLLSLGEPIQANHRLNQSQ